MMPCQEIMHADGAILEAGVSEIDMEYTNDVSGAARASDIL